MTLLVILIWVAVGLLAARYLYRWGYLRGSLNAYADDTETIKEVADNAWKAGWRSAEISRESALDQDEALALTFGDLWLEQQRKAGAEGRN